MEAGYAAMMDKVPTLLRDAHVFDVDPLSGFMPYVEPLKRLPSAWEPWEAILDDAVNSKLQLGDKPCLTENEKTISESWRAKVRELPLLPITELETSHILLRRAHLVLTFVMHFYIQSLPPDMPIIIPRPLSLPLLRVSMILDIPPLLTYSDTVLYNWTSDSSTTNNILTPESLRTKTMFTGLLDEEEFYLCSARIELRGTEALELMRATMDEIFIGDQTAVHRLAGYLHTMARIIDDLKKLLLDVRNGCRPAEYYNEVRPWFRGEDSRAEKPKWVFEGLDEDPSLKPPTELSGPNAGQSSLVHVLDVFLGVDHQLTSPGKPSFMSRMQSYMPRNHRIFLDHLAVNPRPLRIFVMASNNEVLHDAYNKAVVALKEFRDAHMIIVALYIIGPARKLTKEVEVSPKTKGQALLGTGGSDLVKFLKNTRNRTTETVIS